MDADEMAVVAAFFLEEMGIQYHFVFKGDGINWVSVEVVPDTEQP